MVVFSDTAIAVQKASNNREPNIVGYSGAVIPLDLRIRRILLPE